MARPPATRALALVPDLMFGSRVLAAAEEAGIELELLGDGELLRARLFEGEGAEDEALVLVVDLTDDVEQRLALVTSLRESGELASIRTLGFYSHVDASTRERAERAGFDLLVPRSRMAREGAALLARLAG
jgi:hypothetical protein